MPLQPSRELVLTKLRQCFPDEGVAGEALALLDTFPGDTPKGRARVQLAVLKQCDCDLARLRRLVDLAHTDYRDVLVGAEYPEEFPAPRSTPPEEMATIRRRDREQYEAWLGVPDHIRGAPMETAATQPVGPDQYVMWLPASGHNQPLQRTKAAGIISRVRAWFRRGLGR